MHLLLVSVAELVFAWDGKDQGWVRVALSRLGCFRACPTLSEWYLGRGAQFLDVKALYNYLSFPTCENEMKSVVKIHFELVFVERVSLGTGPG